MHILVTGACGYIGSRLVPYLLMHGHHVTAVDNLRYNNGASLAQNVAYDNFKFIRVDVADRQLMAPLYSKVHVIIPLAAIVGQKACDQDTIAAQYINAMTIEHMVRDISKDQWVIIPSTQSGYGIKPDELCTEQTPVKPISLYGRTKVAAERAVMDRENSISLRLATVFGASPRMRWDLLVNNLVWKAYHDQSIVLYDWRVNRAVVYVADVAVAFLHALDKFASMKGNIFNVAGESLTKGSLVEKIGEHTPLNIFHSTLGSDPDQRDYKVSTNKIERAGWKPSITLEQGITELLKLASMMRAQEHGNT